LAGARVRVRVPSSDNYRAIVVPDLAILSDQDQRYVLVVNDENVVVRRTVTPGRLLDDGMRVILPAKTDSENLSPDDWVVVLGLQRARVNYPVNPVDADGKPVKGSAKAGPPTATEPPPSTTDASDDAAH
jgi:multidrug efflux pump subunit AcrA (membrane-fusion protein)